MKKLRDPCFVQFVDFFVMEAGGGREAFLVMAFLDGMPGSSLRDAIKTAGGSPLPASDVLRAFERYARGLVVMHEAGIYHRDIKPSNLYYPAGRPDLAAIMDFGIARDVNGTATHGMVPGTLDYMPPEVVLSENRGDGGMDVYALGLCLYEALTGRTGYPRLPTGTAAYSAFFGRAKSKIPPVFDHPVLDSVPGLRELLLEMTELDPSARLRDASVVVSRIHEIRQAVKGVEDRGQNGPETCPTEWIGVDLGMIRKERRIRAIRRALLGATFFALLASLAFACWKFGVPVVKRHYEQRRRQAIQNVERETEEIERREREAKERKDRNRELDNERERIAAELAAAKKEREAAEALRRQIEEEKRKAEEAEARRAAEEAERRKAEEKRKAEEEAARIAAMKAAEESRLKAEFEAQRKAEEERKAKEEAARIAAMKATEEARLRAEFEAQRKSDEERKAEEEARIAAMKAAEEARLRAEFEAKRKAEDEARFRAEEEARLRAAEEARIKAAEEEARIAAEEKRRAEEEARLRSEAQARLEAEIAEARRKALEEMQRQIAEEEARRKAEAEAKRKAEESERKRIAQEAVRKAEAEKRELAEKALERYDFEEYYDTVKFFYEAKQAGYVLTADDFAKVDYAYKSRMKDLDRLIKRSYAMLKQGRALIRPLQDIEAERRNLMDWYSSLKKR